MKKNFYHLVFAQNYVTYHSSMYSEFFKKSKKKTIVFYEDSSGKSERIERRWGSKLNWGINITKGFKSILLKNYSKDPYSGKFFSRVNLQIPFIIFKTKPKSVFFQGYSDLSSWLILISCFFLGVKIINWKGERVLKKNEKISKLKIFILKFFFFKCCTRIFYSCNGNLKYLQTFDIKKKKLLPMYCSVNNNFFQGEYKKNLINISRIKKQNNFLKKDFIIIIVANFEKRKNIKRILEILPLISEQPIKFILVGSGNDKSDIMFYKRRYKDKIKLTGFIDIKNISKYYSLANLYILLSDYDPSPKTLNEALNFGLPCIVSDNIGTSSDLIKNGINGYIVKNINKFKLCNCIKRVIIDKQFRQRSLIYNYKKLKLYSPLQNANVLLSK